MNSELHPFIENPLKELKSFSKGEIFEARASHYFHSRGVPVLISSLLLRDFGCGQLDILIYAKGWVQVLECKAGSAVLSHSQNRRIKKSMNFLSQVLDCNCRLRVINQLPNI